MQRKEKGVKTRWGIREIRTTTCVFLINFRHVELRKWSTASLIFLQICPACGEQKTARRNVPFAGMWFQDVTLWRIPGHIWALPDFQHHSSLSGKIYSRKCVCDTMGFEINSSYAELLWFAASERQMKSCISSCVFSCAKMLHRSLFSWDFCCTVVYQGDLFGRWTSRCFHYLLQEEIQHVF